ncbi:toll/interleukin-1 receptor domain-containing protein [Limosilactobacillus fermentum]
MIFLSHNKLDKAVVEPIAIRLSNLYGQDNVFYDSWSIQPGDGIIDKMNEGLSKCEFFFFFVSVNSLSSKMVTMEWQNTIMRSAQADVKLIPIRLDGSIMPTILLQTLYIDLFQNGIEVVFKQMVDVINGTNTFHEASSSFSNLGFKFQQKDDSYIFTVEALHYMEPMSKYLLIFDNPLKDLDVKIESSMFQSNSFEDVKFGGLQGNGWYVAVYDATVPGFPVKISVTPKSDIKPNFRAILHQVSEEKWQIIPPINSFSI